MAGRERAVAGTGGAPDAHARWLADVVTDAADGVGIGIAVTQLVPEVRNVLATAAMASLFGYEPEEFASMSPLDVFQGAEVERVGEAMEAFLRRGELPAMFRTNARRRDGSIVTLDASITLIAGGSFPRVASFAVDTSRLRVAEESLAASDERLMQVLDRLPDPVFATRDGELVFASRALRALLGLAEAGLAGSDPSLEAIRVEGASPPAAGSSPEASTIGEVAVSSSSGRRVTLEGRVTRAEFRGQPVELWFCRDLTEQKQIEAQRIQADRLATLGTLAGGLAHAINNPLSSVLLNLDDLVRRIPALVERPELRQGIEERLALAREAADRVAGVVAQLRLFSRMRRSDEFGDVDVRRVVEGAIELVANEVRHRGQLELGLRPVPPVRGFEGRIEHALLTLLILAVRMLPDRPAGRSRLVVETDYGGQSVDLVVRCEGAALPSALGELGTDPFVPGGSERGIGLAICQDIVQSIGGTLDVTGHGSDSTFRVRLPSAGWQGEPGSGGGDADATVARQRGSRARVLVIDDDPGVLGALRLMLQDRHDVTVMQNPREAVADVAGGAAYDVVLCDFSMPGLTGEGVYDAVRHARPGFERRIVFMTGAAFQPEADHFFSRVPNARIDKPFDLEEVERLVLGAVR